MYLGEKYTALDFREFPDEALPDKRAKRALLAHASDLVLTMMSKMLGDLLKGMSPRYSNKRPWLTEPGICDESKIEEIGIVSDAPLEVQLFSRGTAKYLDSSSAMHWLFGVTLANGERYAVDLCTSRFSPVPGAEPLSCVAPLEQHVQRLASSADGVVQGCVKKFGHHRQAAEEDILEAPPEEIANAIICNHDVHCLARKLALKHLEDANQHWLRAQSTTWNKALDLPGPKFAHVFCTIVWPIELMARERREREADPLTIMSTIMGGVVDLRALLSACESM